MSSSAARSASVEPGRDHAAAGKLDALRAEIRLVGRSVVAFSGGADSALVARVATDVLGRDVVLCVTAVSASLAPEELAECRALAREWGLRWQTVPTKELEDPAYRANDGDRCYHCKRELFGKLRALAREMGLRHVLDGGNADDVGDFRPGARWIELSIPGTQTNITLVTWFENMPPGGVGGIVLRTGGRWLVAGGRWLVAGATYALTFYT